MPPSGTSNKPPAKDAGPQDALVILKGDIENHFSNLYYHGWCNRSSEASLYPLYSLIFTLTCLNLRHPNEHRLSLMSCPQPFFGEIPPPGKPGDHDPSDPSARKPPKPTKKQERLLPPFQYPDFARLLIFAGGEDSDRKSPSDFGLETAFEISEFSELKRLNCRDRWWSREGRTTAKDAVRAFLPQVYDAAMAGFAYNPEWKTVYAILIVGVYFTQVCWQSRPSDEALNPIISTKIPATIKKGAPYPKLKAKVVQEIDQYSNRIMPTVSFFNEPVFTYDPPKPPRGATRPSMSLSPNFLYALSKPTTTRFSQLSSRSTLFDSQAKEPGANTGSRSEAEVMVEDVLKSHPIRHLEDTARALGHSFAGDPPPTPTPPNSTAEVRYKPKISAKDVKQLPALHIETRTRMKEALFRYEKDDENEEADGDAGEVERQ